MSKKILESEASLLGIRLSEPLEFEPAMAVYVELPEMGVIRVHGEESEKFLQAQLINDVSGLSAGEAHITGYCNHQGRMIGIYWLLRRESDWLMVCHAELIATTLEAIRKYILRTKVTFTDGSQDYGVMGFSPSKPSPDADALPANSCWWSAGENRHLGVVERANLPTAAHALGSTRQRISPAGWRALEISDGFPPLEPSVCSTYLPQMLNLDRIGGIGFHKGCYPGQEIIARTHYRGQVKRRLFTLYGETGPVAEGILAPGSDLYPPQSDKPAGKIVDRVLIGENHVLLQAVLALEPRSTTKSYRDSLGHSLRVVSGG